MNFVNDGISKPRLLRITTVPISQKLLLAGQMPFFTSKGFDVLAVSASGSEIVDDHIDGIPHQVIPFTRKITPWQDLKCLFLLIRVIRQFKPDIVHTHTPKAGLIGMLAAWICRVPVRMHTVAGLPLMEKEGGLRTLLIWIEKITYACATRVYPNSTGLRDFIETNIGFRNKLTILGNGSSNGIDTRFFSRTPELEQEARSLRVEYQIPDDAVVFCFVGRVVRDKGISELLHAFMECRRVTSSKMKLLIVGPLEQDLDPLSDEDLKRLKEDEDIILAGYQKDVRPFMVASDVFTFPSYREGFPNVVMQACCLEVATIVSNINGCNEIIENKKTGIIVQPKDADSLSKAMLELVVHEEKRRLFAKAGREKVVRDFDQQFVWSAIERAYHQNLRAIIGSSFLYRNFFKPLIDKLAALIVLIVTSPLILISMALLTWANSGKVWFRQVRPGLHGKLFRVIKFKTMNDARDPQGNLLPDEVRLHSIGKFIRKTSIDELPQLLNVLFGDMSLVGPRPLLEEYLPLYNDEQRIRHHVKPGITGWAQVNGRNAISWQQKFAYDVWYVRNQSFLLDVRILFLTVLKVFKAEGISSNTSVTMEKFRGNS